MKLSNGVKQPFILEKKNYQMYHQKEKFFSSSHYEQKEINTDYLIFIP